jgi:hypothetical protein
LDRANWPLTQSNSIFCKNIPFKRPFFNEGLRKMMGEKYNSTKCEMAN